MILIYMEMKRGLGVLALASALVNQIEIRIKRVEIIRQYIIGLKKLLTILTKAVLLLHRITKMAKKRRKRALLLMRLSFQRNKKQLKN